MTPDRAALAAALRDSEYRRFTDPEFAARVHVVAELTGRSRISVAESLAVADALLAGPLAEATPGGVPTCVPCRTQMRQLGDDPSHWCCPGCGATALLRDPPDVDALLAAVDRLTVENAGYRSANEYLGRRVTDLIAERDQARDLAFRAAFAPEEGTEVQWGTEWSDGGVTEVRGFEDNERTARHIGRREERTVVRRVVGPWRPVTSD